MTEQQYDVKKKQIEEAKNKALCKLAQQYIDENCEYDIGVILMDVS